ncbi:MAG: two-component system response regulator [Actinomycetota bacterium]
MMYEGGDPRVAVIDANAHIRRLIVTLLGALTVRDTVEARTPTAATAHLLKKAVDLVIVDWTGDATDAVLFVHRLRRGEFGRADIPVLALSPSTHHAVLERAYESGIDDVIAKPVSALDVIQRSGALIDEYRRRTAVPAAAAAE